MAATPLRLLHFTTMEVAMKSAELVTCPNCKGRSSQHWPFGPCTICRGTGKTTPERREQVLANKRQSIKT